MYTDYSPDNGGVPVQLSFVVGTTGAVGAVTGGRELGTPVRNGVGDYSFPLANTAIRSFDAEAYAVGVYSTTAGKRATIIADSSASTSAPLIRVQFYRLDTGAAAEVAQNDVVVFKARLKYKD
jgi:hypothetical protein